MIIQYIAEILVLKRQSAWYEHLTLSCDPIYWHKYKWWIYKLEWDVNLISLCNLFSMSLPVYNMWIIRAASYKKVPKVLSHHTKKRSGMTLTFQKKKEKNSKSCMPPATTKNTKMSVSYVFWYYYPWIALLAELWKKDGRSHTRPTFFWYDTDSGHCDLFAWRSPIVLIIRFNRRLMSTRSLQTRHLRLTSRIQVCLMSTFSYCICWVSVVGHTNFNAKMETAVNIFCRHWTWTQSLTIRLFLMAGLVGFCPRHGALA